MRIKVLFAAKIYFKKIQKKKHVFFLWNIYFNTFSVIWERIVLTFCFSVPTKNKIPSIDKICALLFGLFFCWVDFNHYNCFGRRLFKIFSHVYLIPKYFLTQKIVINFESEFGFSGVVKILTVSDAEKNVCSRSAIFEGGSFRYG